MRQVFEIEWWNKLEWEVTASGSKNAWFPIIAGSLLLNRAITLSNVPDIADFRDFMEILRRLGVAVERRNVHSYHVDPSGISSTRVDEILGNKIRGSYYMLGSLVSRLRSATIPQPWGCNIGKRPMGLHLEALKQFGVEFQSEGENLRGELPRLPDGKVEIQLPFPSRGATINSLLTIALLEGIEACIKNSDQSPETSSLIEFLKLAGLSVERCDRDIHVIGAKELRLEEYAIAPDKIEVWTMLTGGLITNGEVAVRGIRPEDLGHLQSILRQIWAQYQLEQGIIRVRPNQLASLKPAFLISGHHSPCIDADYEPVFTPLLCRVGGDSLIDDTINPERHARFIPTLNAIGADIIETSSTRAVIRGARNKKFSSSSELRAEDIRGWVAQLIAALTAEGTSTLANIAQIDRGYENLERKFGSLGGKIRRVTL